MLKSCILPFPLRALKDELNHNLRTSYLWYQEQKAYGISYKFTQSDPLVTFDYNLYF